MTSGAIITMAVNSPTGMYLRLRKANRLLVSSSTPRRHWNCGCAVRSSAMPRSGSTTSGGGHRLEGVAEPQRHQQRHAGADELGGGVQRREAGHRPITRPMPARSVRTRGRAAARRPARRLTGCGRPAVPTPASARRAGRAACPRSVWLSSGLWKSLPREAARPNSQRRLGVLDVLGRRCGCRSRLRRPAAVGLEFGEQRVLLVGGELVAAGMGDHGHAAGAR